MLQGLLGLQSQVDDCCFCPGGGGVYCAGLRNGIEKRRYELSSFDILLHDVQHHY